MKESLFSLHSPIIVIGMHRSGTSMVTGMLTAMGVFMHPNMRPPAPGEMLEVPNEQRRRDGYGEAELFRLLNERIMERSGATWDDVQPFLDRRDTPWMTRTSVLMMQNHVKRRLYPDFLDHMPEWSSGPWGWKDPRSSLLLPYWLQVFPQARILHVRRDPEAIARSLIRRAPDSEQEPVTASVARSAWLKSLGRRLVLNPSGVAASVGMRLGLRPRHHGTKGSITDRDYCLHLTDQYVQECLKFRSHGDRYLEIAYEDVLQDPASMALRMAQFAGLPDSAFRILQAAHFVQLPRSQAILRARALEPRDVVKT
ncbi:MAG TPA: sulfotransferase [Chthonomonadaceae bacterium]|nr:sulfotransferase [Chthonomonadaceae bacterium]